MSKSSKRYKKTAEAINAMTRRQLQKAQLDAAVERCGPASGDGSGDGSIFAKAPLEAMDDIDHPYWDSVCKKTTRDGMIFMLSLGDTIYYKGQPFGTADHWTSRGCSVRVHGVHRLTDCEPTNDTLVGLVVTHIELTPVHLLSGLFTVGD